MTTSASHVGIWQDFARELANRPDVIRKLIEDHRPTTEGLCQSCTTPGRGTPRVPWPCPMATLARDASRALHDGR